MDINIANQVKNNFFSAIFHLIDSKQIFNHINRLSFEKIKFTKKVETDFESY